ncbi:hypothetical protein [Mesorhizobium abyssinicae]|uniref:hypothetical protein n=1 Tax=Mesorhizobium abyssinicae TaxID=1209958 RepID=UPI003398C8EB
MAGVTNSVIAAIATDRCLFGRKDKIRTPRLLRTTTVWRAYRLHRRVARKRLGGNADNSIQMRLWMFAFG